MRVESWNDGGWKRAVHFSWDVKDGLICAGSCERPGVGGFRGLWVIGNDMCTNIQLWRWVSRQEMDSWEKWYCGGGEAVGTQVTNQVQDPGGMMRCRFVRPGCQVPKLGSGIGRS